MHGVVWKAGGTVARAKLAGLGAMRGRRACRSRNGGWPDVDRPHRRGLRDRSEPRSHCALSLVAPHTVVEAEGNYEPASDAEPQSQLSSIK